MKLTMALVLTGVLAPIPAPAQTFTPSANPLSGHSKPAINGQLKTGHSR
jgi:hypothetical protein